MATKMSDEIQAKQAPPLSIPKSDNCCRLSVINTTTDIVVPCELLIEPAMEGKKWLNLPTFAFHIKNDQTGKELLFDLGCRKDWENIVPHFRQLLEAGGVGGLKVTKDVVDILPDGDVDVKNIEALVLSHWHFDHCGNLETLPKSTKLLVGPGFRDRFLPGWPAKADSTFHEAEFEGRDVVEVPFTTAKIGQFEYYDYFGDGSFYILNVPGHTIGHISAFVRTTPDTFVFLGGDVCHFVGDLRPSLYIPMPSEIPAETVMDKRIPLPCPCTAFLSGHRDQENPRTTPFFTCSSANNSFYEFPELARKSIESLIAFDADPNVMIAIAHDPTLLDTIDFFPATINDWASKDTKRIGHWSFLSEMPYNGVVVRPPLVDGTYQGGKKMRGLEG